MKIDAGHVQSAVDLNSDSGRAMISTASQTTSHEQADLHKEANPAVDKQQLQKVVDQWNQNAEKKNQELRLAIHEETNRMIVEVVDLTTKKVISTFPPKQILALDDALEREWKLLDKRI
ncbi:flagellar protein FlaG [Sporomusaceae bacterium BoRhaA]|uniref:flagellar protein FlaG n=1 Tax=Pelorhabdus rhamnosifermentans TaxID=2772457 RepID=UPI001C05FD81|nr:flagellar protein FlaG [Pelorhabdus rhamnosifermentans]MBU2699154.1 flagellar protein FlaG [Pelorhabdus rhamnosifermentans]